MPSYALDLVEPRDLLGVGLGLPIDDGRRTTDDWKAETDPEQIRASSGWRMHDMMPEDDLDWPGHALALPSLERKPVPSSRSRRISTSAPRALITGRALRPARQWWSTSNTASAIGSASGRPVHHADPRARSRPNGRLATLDASVLDERRRAGSSRRRRNCASFMRRGAGRMLPRMVAGLYARSGEVFRDRLARSASRSPLAREGTGHGLPRPRV